MQWFHYNEGRIMNRLFIAVLCGFFVFSSAYAAEETGKITGGINFEIPSWFKTSFLEIAEDSKEAQEEDKHVMLFMHLNGCPYCNKMVSENFANAALKPYLQKHFDSIALNIQGDREIQFNEEVMTTERILASYLKVKYTPTIIFLNGDNKTVLRLNGYRSPETMKQALEFVNSKSYLKTSFNRYKSKHMNVAQFKLADSPLFSKTTDFSNLNTPVAVLFEDKSCNECSAFHKNMLSRSDIQTQFKRYTLVRLDALSNDQIIDFKGNKTTPKKWAEALKLSYRPGIILFDEKSETARVESLLYPFHFESVLRFGLDKHYKSYNSYLDLMGERIAELTRKGIDVNIGKMSF